MLLGVGLAENGNLSGLYVGIVFCFAPTCNDFD